MIKCTQEDWEALGLEPGASIQAIKRAFRRKVKQCHPDLRGGDETSTVELKELVRAYERVTASTEAAARVNSMFQSVPPAAIPARCAAPAAAPMDGWLTRSIIERVHQSFQVVLLLALLVSPFVTLAIGSVALRPALERYAEHQPAARSHRYDNDRKLEYLRALAMNGNLSPGANSTAGGAARQVNRQ